MIIHCSVGRIQRKQSFLSLLFVMAIVKMLNKASFPNWLLTFPLFHAFPEALMEQNPKHVQV